MGIETLPAIVYNESFGTQFLVSSYIIASALFLNLLFYTCMIALMLAAVEEPVQIHQKESNDLLLDHEAIHLYELAFLDEFDGAAAQRQQRLFRQRKPARWKSVLSNIWKRLWPFYKIVWHSPDEANNMVTRSLPATIRHLRYFSGSGFFCTRALLLWLFWYRVLPTAVECIVHVILFAMFSVIPMFIGLQSGRNWFPVDTAILLVVRCAYFALASEHIAFHTVRVLSASTQITTNIFTSLWDPSIFQPQRTLRWPSKTMAIGGILYGLATFLTSLLPYLIIYGPAYATVSNVNAPRPEPASNSLLIMVRKWQIAIAVSTTVPVMVYFTRLHARFVDPKEPTIVRFHIRSPFWIRKESGVRILRMLIHCSLAYGTSATAILLLGGALFNKIEYATELRVWFYQSYLDPQWNWGVLRYFGTAYFWRNNLLVSINPWGFVLSTSDEFNRYLVFGTTK